MAKFIQREVLASDMFTFKFKEFASVHTINESIDALVAVLISGTPETGDDAFGEELGELSDAEKVRAAAACFRHIRKQELNTYKANLEYNLRSELDAEYRDIVSQKDSEIAKLNSELEKSRQGPNPLNVQFILQLIVLFIFCAAVCAYIVFVEGGKRSEISIEYNVGEIIGGILGGGGVAAAGIAYAIYRIKSRD